MNDTMKLAAIVLLFISAFAIVSFACDNDFCRSDSDCNDYNSCTVDVCDHRACSYTTLEDGTQCDDSNAGTINDVCASGLCVGETDSDCDDSKYDVNPGAPEVCDGLDNNCDGEVDEGCECYCDEQCDDYNVCTVDQCVDGSCVFSNAEDGTVCDDGNSSTVNDVCSVGVCVGQTDNDGDGYGNDDCDDSNPNINPGAEENCGDGIDNNCNGLIDCEDPACSEFSSCVPPTPVPTGGGGGGFVGAITGPTTECGNDLCEYKEDCSTCPEDCLKKGEICCDKVAYTGNCCVDADCGAGFECDISKICVSIPVIIPSGCEENWTCTDWSACVDGNMTRTCVDENDCRTEIDKPAEVEACETVSPITGLLSFLTTPTAYGILLIALAFLMLFLWKRSQK